MDMSKFQKTASMVIAAALLNTSVVWAQAPEDKLQKALEKEQKKTEAKAGELKEKPQKENNAEANSKAEKKQELKIRKTDSGLEFEVEDMEELELEIVNELKIAKDQSQQSVTDSVYDTKSPERAKGLRKIVSKLESSDKLSEKDLIKLALSYKTLGENEKAIESAKKALEANPESQKPLIIMAQVYRAMNDPEKAMEELNQITTQNPDAKVKAFMAILKEEEGNLEEAKELLQDAVQGVSKEAELYRKLGEIKEKLGDHGLKVYVKGKTPEFDVKPTIINDRTVVPIRAVSEALDAKVDYDAAAHKVIITKGDIKIELPIGVNEALVNGKEYVLETPAVIIDDRTMVPLRFVSEALNTEVLWQGDTSTVIINEK